MTRPRVPQSVLDAAHARKAARQARDWDEADRLKTEIERAGWVVVDRGLDFSLRPAHPPDVDDGWRIRYGSSATVPSRLAEAATAPVSVVFVAGEEAPPSGERLEALRASVAALHAGAPDVPLVIVAGDPPEARARAIRDLATPGIRAELVWTNGRLSDAGLANAGIRRSSGEVIVLVRPGVAIDMQALRLLGAALPEASTAIVGREGITGSNVRDLRPAGPGPVVALDGTCVAVRREDAERLPLDERFVTWRGAAIAWSLALRAIGAGSGPRAALALDLPLTVAVDLGREHPDQAKADRRDRYRLAEAFDGRRELFEGNGPG